MISKEELKLLWPFYMEAFLGTVLFIMIPFMVVYFSSLGFSATQIGFLLAAMPLASLIFEIPTGAIADLYGRKFSTILGWGLEGLLCISLFFVSGFYSIAIILFLIGFSGTLVSGSYEAWAVDLAGKLTNRYFATKQSLYNLAFIFSGILGAVLVARFGISIIWPVSGVALLISVFFLSFGKESFKPEKVKIKESFKRVLKQTKEAINYSYKHPVLFYLLLISTVTVLFSSVNSFLSWTPLLEEYGFPASSWGYIWSAAGLLGVIVPLFSLKVKKMKKALIFSSIGLLLYCLGVFFSSGLYFAIGMILFFFVLADFESPIWKTYMHSFIPSKTRATVGSIDGLLASIVAIIALPLIGFLIDFLGARTTILASGLLMVICLIFYSRIRE